MHGLIVTTALHDERGRIAIAFVAVDSLARDPVDGRVWHRVRLVSGYRLRQLHAFREQALLDRSITVPDGSEEGHVIWKFIDSLQQR